MKTMRTLALSLILVAMGLAYACDSDGDDDGHDVAENHDDTAEHEDAEGEDTLHSAVEDACVHLQTGPFEPVTAAGSADGAPQITPGHKTNEVTLAAEGGFLTLTVDDHGEFLVATTVALAVTLADEDGNEIAPEQSPDVSDHCAAIATAHTFHLDGGSYALSFTSDGDTTELDLFVGQLGDSHHDEDEEHK